MTTTPARRPLLKLEGAEMHFRARARLFRTTIVRALDGVDVDLARGETLAIVGESGSGKTTLGRITLRLLEPTGGRVHFDGQDITDLPDSRLKEFRRRAQGVFQDPFTALDSFMTIRQIVEEPLVIHNLGNRRDRLDRVEWALDEVRLRPASDLLDRYPHTLSGGQRQRVGIARALVLTPEYILADEPVSMIDASSRAEILALLNDLQERHGVAYLYITHDIATARHFAPRTAVMYLGRIVEEGPTAQLIEQPLHPYTQGLLAAVPEPDPANRLAERDVLPGEPPSPANVPAGCRFHPRCPAFMAGLCNVIDPATVVVNDQSGASHSVACHLHTEEGHNWRPSAPAETAPSDPA